MHRFLLALIAFLAVGAAASFAADRPTVVVFPFASSATLDPQANAKIIALLGTEIGLEDHVTVMKADAGVQRDQYLSAARKLGAEFYVTGFLTPLGNGASIIEQIVSTQSGVVVFSNSGQLTSVADASGQGDILRGAIIARGAANRNYATFPEGPPPSAGPHPAEAGPQATPTQGANASVGSLFHRRRSAAAPSPSPSPSPGS